MRSVTSKAIIGLGAAIAAGVLTVAFIGVPAGYVVSQALVLTDPKLAHAVRIGKVRFKLLPRPALIAANISISDPDGSHSKLVQIRQADLQASMGGLFSGKPHFTSLALRGATFSAEAPTAFLSKIADENGLKEIREQIDRLDIEDSSVTKTTASGGEEILAGNINAKLVLNSAAGPNLNATAHAGPYTIKMTAASGQSRFPSSNLFPIKIGGAVEKDRSNLMSASLVMTRDAAANLINCGLISGSFQGQPFRAWATLDTSHKKPTIAATADFGTLTFPEAGPQSGELADVLNDVLAGDLFDLGFQVSASKVQGPSIKLAPAYAEGTLSNGKLTMEISKTLAHGGSLAGEVSAERGGLLRSSFKLRGAQLSQVLGGISWHDAISGSLDADGTFVTPSAQDTAIRSLSGKLALKVKNGAMEASSITNIIQSILNTHSQPALNAEAKLPFSLAAKEIAIDHGIAVSNNITFESSLIRASGHGNADLGRETLDFVFDPQIVSTGNPAPEDTGVRVGVTGTFERPVVSTTGLGGAIIGKLQSEAADALGLNKQQRATIQDTIKTFEDWFNSGRDTDH